MKLVILSDLLNRILDTIFVMCIKCEVHPNNRHIVEKNQKKERKKASKQANKQAFKEKLNLRECRASGAICLSQRVLRQIRESCLKEASLKGGCPEAKVLTHLMRSGSCFHTYSQRKKELKQEKQKKRDMTKCICVKEEVNKRSEDIPYPIYSISMKATIKK